MFKFADKIRSNPQQGATVVEFAVIAALLMVILFGIMEYALIFLQEHYIANAAREGARIAARANNYDCDQTEPLPGVTDDGICDADRTDITKLRVAEFLSQLYDTGIVYNTTSVETVDLDGDNTSKDDRVVKVRVIVDNPFTNITPNLLKLLSTDSDIENPDKISFVATMELENQEEFIEE